MKTIFFNLDAIVKSSLLIFASTLTSFIFAQDPCIPPTGGIIGSSEINCGSYYAELIENFETPTGTDCGNSDGDDTCEDGDKPISFTIIYNGEGCSQSDNNQGEKGGKWDCEDYDGGPNGDQSVYIVTNDDFSGTVSLSGSFTVTNGGDKLSNPLELEVYDQQNGNLLQYVEIHTSCSSPIVMGDQFGSMLLVGVEYENGLVYSGDTGISYKWQKMEGAGSWVYIEGATGLEYDPGEITQTTKYRREVVNCCGTDFSNIVVKEVTPGIIASAGPDVETCENTLVTLTASVNSGENLINEGFIFKADNESSSNPKYNFEDSGSKKPRLRVYVNGNGSPIIINESKLARIESLKLDHNHSDPKIGYDDNNGNHRTLLYFDVSSITGNIDHAEIVLNSKDNHSDLDISVYALTENWDEDYATWEEKTNNVNWGTAGALSATSTLLDIQTVTDDVEYAWDVTSQVNTWVNGVTPSTGDYSYVWSTGELTQSIEVSTSQTKTYTVTVTDNLTGCYDSDEVTVYISDDFIDPGKIGVDQSNCGGFDPEILTSIMDATGSCSTNENSEDCCESGGDKPTLFVLKYNGQNCGQSDNNQGEIGGKWDCEDYNGGPNGDESVYIVTNDDFSGTVSINGLFTATNGGDKLSNPLELEIYDQQNGTLLQYVEIHTSCSSPIVMGDQFGSLVLQESVFENNYACIGISETIEYQWQSMVPGGEWIDIPGAVSETYDPPFIDSTIKYRRLAINCCGKSASNEITIEVFNEVDASASNDGPVTCLNPVIQLSAGPNGLTYFWTGPNGFTSNMQNPSTNLPGVYTVLVTDPVTGCNDTASTTVEADVLTPNAFASNDGPITCDNLVIQLSAGPIGLQYAWIGPKGFTSNLQNPTTTTAGIYTVTVTNPMNGCFAMASTTVVEEELAVVGDFVWFDINYNGIQEFGENGIDGVMVSLYEAGTNILVDQTFSLNGGAYEFEVCKGEYYIVFGEEENKVRSPQNTTNNNIDSDPNVNTGKTTVFVLNPGDFIDHIDAGYSSVADLNLVKTVDNSTPNPGESVRFTITVTNEGPDDATGVEVSDEVPNGYSNLTNIMSGGVLSGTTITWTGLSISSGSSVNLTFDATVEVSNDDELDYENIAQVDAADQYDIDSTPGNDADTDGDGNIGSQDPDEDRDPDDEDDGDNASVLPVAKIAGHVYEEIFIFNNEEGDVPFPGVTIKLLDVNGDQAVDIYGDPVPNQITKEDGYYEFSNLRNGEYTVMQVQPDGYYSLLDEDRSDDDITDISDTEFTDNMIPVSLTIGECDDDNDFIEEEYGTISGYVLKNGGPDGASQTPVENEIISLFDADGDLIRTQSTDADGYYFFDEVPRGTYKVSSPDAEVGCEDVSDQDESTDPFIDPDGGNDPVDNMILVFVNTGEDDEDNNFVDAITVVIPVELLDFDAYRDGTRSRLEWQTATEINNSHFIIERSIDGSQFESIGKVEGAGNSLEIIEYQYFDESPQAGSNYYRLAQYDFDGTVSYSEIRIVEFGKYILGTATVKIYPNPVVDYAFFEAQGLIGDISLFIFDSRGAIVKSEVIKAGTQFDLTDLAAGQYIFKMYDQDRYLIGTEKIIVIEE